MEVAFMFLVSKPDTLPRRNCLLVRPCQLESGRHLTLEGGLLRHQLFHRARLPGLSDSDESFAHMTESPLHVTPRQWVESMHVEVVAQRLFGRIQIERQMIHGEKGCRIEAADCP